MAFPDRFRRGGNVGEGTVRATPAAKIPERSGYAYGIPAEGLTEYNSAVGSATGVIP